jgi:C1A family cysteine protease
MPAKRKTTKRFNAKKYVLKGDWTFEDALFSDVVRILSRIPSSKDLRENWWVINNQGSTGACVGFATAYGVLRWHYVKDGKIKKNEMPSARFVWMANKETDQITSFPTTFIETAGTQTKLALRVVQRYGCVKEDILPMSGELSMLSRAAFYTQATKLRISSYHNLGRDLDKWKKWLASQGPILTRLNVDRTWDRASFTQGHLKEYQPNTVRGGHAVCLVGYTKDYFIVRNSWGTDWGDGGFAYASHDYTAEAFTEAYGAVL